MIFLILIVLGIVQGLTEFLPVSSSGHLVILYNIFKINNNNLFLSVILHIATLLAVLWVYKKDLWYLIKNPFCKTNKLLVVATIPTVIIALVLKNVIVKTFSGNFIIIGFFITSIMLFISQFYMDSNNTKSCNITNINFNYFNALLIGIFQGFACFPGISRSGSTISCGLFQKLNKEEVANFSFLLSIPVIFGSLIFELKDLFLNNTVLNFDLLPIVCGFISAFLVGILSIKIMLKFIKNKKLYVFSFYLLFLNLILIILNLYFA